VICHGLQWGLIPSIPLCGFPLVKSANESIHEGEGDYEPFTGEGLESEVKNTSSFTSKGNRLIEPPSETGSDTMKPVTTIVEPSFGIPRDWNCVLSGGNEQI
jgi:hypothetical protein